jgi:hypothetical protein
MARIPPADRTPSRPATRPACAARRCHARHRPGSRPSTAHRTGSRTAVGSRRTLPRDRPAGALRAGGRSEKGPPSPARGLSEHLHADGESAESPVGQRQRRCPIPRGLPRIPRPVIARTRAARRCVRRRARAPGRAWTASASPAPSRRRGSRGETRGRPAGRAARHLRASRTWPGLSKVVLRETNGVALCWGHYPDTIEERSDAP